METTFGTFTGRDWRNLLTDIYDGQAVPVVGSELSVLPGQGGLTLYEHVARELVCSFKLDESQLPPGYGLLQATGAYLQNPRNQADDLHYEARSILCGTAWPVPDPLRKLAEIGGFNLFVSTTVDSLLDQAINEARFAGAKRTRCIAYCEKSQVQDLPESFSTSPQPTVFHLFGRVNASGDYAITEEKVLEFSHRLQSRDLQPHNLFDQLRKKNLLILGCSFPGWLARFLLRASKGDQYPTLGARGVLADRTSRSDQEFVMFLERRRTTVYTDGDAAAFVDELHRRWTEQYGQLPPPVLSDEQPAADAFKPASVFLSYANEDLEAAERVAAALDDAGVDVWFDKVRLEAGDSFRAQIEKNIESCSYFVPLISRHTITLEKSFFRREWKKAIEEAEEWPPEYPFIQPLLIDDTPLKDPAIPPEFRARHMRTLANLPEFIEDARRRIRERRRERRSA